MDAHFRRRLAAGESVRRRLDPVAEGLAPKDGFGARVAAAGSKGARSTLIPGTCCLWRRKSGDRKTGPARHYPGLGFLDEDRSSGALESRRCDCRPGAGLLRNPNKVRRHAWRLGLITRGCPGSTSGVPGADLTSGRDLQTRFIEKNKRARRFRYTGPKKTGKAPNKCEYPGHHNPPLPQPDRKKNWASGALSPTICS